MRIITLCGSTKFKTDFRKFEKILALKGNLVLSLNLFGQADNIKFTEEQAIFLDDAQRKRISLSDAIFVINKNGYIGESTKKEIKYARDNKKNIFYME